MPCNMLAVATGELQHDISADALSTPAVVEAIQALMAMQLGIEKNAVTMYNNSEEFGWFSGYHAWVNNLPIPAFSPEILVGSKAMYWVSERIAVMVSQNGKVTYRDGWDLSNPLEGDELTRFQTEMSGLLNQLGIVMAQEKTVTALSTIGTITSDQYQPLSGARVLNVSLQL